MTAALAASALAPAISIIPAPLSVVQSPGTYQLPQVTEVYADKGSASAAAELKDRLATPTGIKFVNASRQHAHVRLSVDPKLNWLEPEGYRLKVDRTGVTIKGKTSAGVFYGVQTLRQLLPTDSFNPARSTRKEWHLPYVAIEDEPRFKWRGLMLDVCRHYFPTSTLYKFIDLLAVHKMNTLHLHLSEDQGWRFESARYPNLTKTGAWRKESMVGHARDQKFDGTPHGGFYTQVELKSLVGYAAQRHINIVPEIEMPGHSTAAVASYPWLGNNPEMQIDVGTRWGVYPSVFSPEESTFKFLEDVLTEVMEVFPSKFIHIGGDECPKDEWKASPSVQALMKRKGIEDEHALQSWFIKRIDLFLTKNGRRLVGWDEILEGGLAQGATVMAWRGMDGGIAAAKAGHDIVMAPTSHTYFDYYQGQDKSKEPVAIGGYLPISKVYGFDPVPKELAGPASKHVLGTQGQLWSEYIPTPDHLEYMAFPRACALSEVGWTAVQNKNLDKFMDRLGVHKSRLKALGVNFRP